MNKYAEWITVNEGDYLGLMRQRDEARRIARALYRVLLAVEAFEQEEWYFDVGKTTYPPASYWPLKRSAWAARSAIDETA